MVWRGNPKAGVSSLQDRATIQRGFDLQSVVKRPGSAAAKRVLRAVALGEYSGEPPLHWSEWRRAFRRLKRLGLIKTVRSKMSRTYGVTQTRPTEAGIQTASGPVRLGKRPKSKGNRRERAAHRARKG